MVNDIHLMQVREAGSDIPDELPQGIRIAFSDEGEGRRRAVRHDKERPAFADVEMVGVQEVRMVQVVGGLVLLLEFLDSAVVQGDVDLDGDLHVQLRVAGEPNFTEGSASLLFQENVPVCK